MARSYLYYSDICEMEELEILSIGLFGKNRETGLYTNSLSDHLRTSHKHINKPHKHDFFVTVLFTGGTGTHDIEFTRYDVTRGSLFFLKPGQTHNWTLSEDAEGFVFFHSQEYFERHFTDSRLSDFGFFANLQQIQAILLTDTELADAISIINRIFAENESGLHKSHLMLLAMLSEFYISIDRISKPETAQRIGIGSYENHFSAFNQLLDKNFREEKSAQVYADKLNVTAKHLNRICKMLVGKTTSELIAERIVLEAKRELFYTKKNFTEIGYGLGFQDYAYFSRLFKKLTGSTPSEFRKKYA